DNHRPQECKICLEYFNTRERRPRSLPCGHTFCTRCIGDLIKNMKISCPHCRAKHVLKQATELPVSYIVEEFMAREKYVDERPISTVCQNAESLTLGERENRCYDHSIDWTVRSLNRYDSIPVTRNRNICCFSHAFRRIRGSVPNWMKVWDVNSQV
ncbi:hypothetical protein SK128_005466, partial [Halocaridina rubra]